MRYTYLGLIMLALGCVLYLEGFLFENLIPAFCGLGIVAYMVYSRLAFGTQVRTQRLEVKREVLEKMLFADKPFTVLTRVRNLGGPAKVHLEDVLPEGLEVRSGSNRTHIELNSGEAAKLRYTVQAHRRGYYDFQRIAVRATDRAGMFDHGSVLAHPSQVRVHSSREELRKAHTIAKREHLEVLGKSPERWSRTREFEFEGIREFTPGDRFRDVDWKTVSRTMKLMTKVYEREAMVPTTIMLDCGRSMRISAEGGSKLDHGMRLSMQLAKVLLSGYHPTGVIAFNELGTIVKVGPDVVRGQYDKILRALLRLPEEIETEQELQQPAQPGKDANAAGTADGERFVKVVSAYVSSAGGRARTKTGAEDLVRAAIERGGKGQMFMVVSDLESNHDSVIRAATLARNRGHRVILISPFSAWYGVSRQDLGVEEVEREYDAYMVKLHSIAKLRRLGAMVIELGPRDEAASVAKQVRRMVT
jgi:uncharacterized protein (DUF58 family)